MATQAIPSSEDSQKQTVLIVNPVEFQENILQCQICVCKYNKSERRPKILTCGHVFCLSCLKKIFDADDYNTYTYKLKCPTCRSETKIKKNIKDLTPALYIEQMMEVIATTETLNLCAKHQGQTLNFYCLTCSVPVCRDCTVIDHNKSGYHNITDFSKVLADRTDQFEKLKIESKEVFYKLQSRSWDLETALKNLDIIVKDELIKVDNKCDEFTASVKERQTQLKTEISNTKERLKNGIQKQNNHVKEKRKKFQEVYDTFCEVINSKDINKMLTMNEEMKANKENFRKDADEDDTELLQSVCVKFDGVVRMPSLDGLGKIMVYKEPRMKLYW